MAMNAPREVKIAIFLSWAVVVIETIERLWRISVDPDARTFTRFGFILTALALSSAAIVGATIFFASRRRNWGRIALLACTLGAWSLWFLWPRAFDEYLTLQWIAYGAIAAMELVALLLLFVGPGAAWYRAAE